MSAADPRTAAFVDKLLAPLPVAERLDWRGEEESAEHHLARAQEWLNRHHPRFNGREAQ